MYVPLELREAFALSILSTSHHILRQSALMVSRDFRLDSPNPSLAPIMNGYPNEYRYHDRAHRVHVSNLFHSGSGQFLETMAASRRSKSEWARLSADPILLIGVFYPIFQGATIYYYWALTYYTQITLALSQDSILVTVIESNAARIYATVRQDAAGYSGAKTVDPVGRSRSVIRIRIPVPREKVMRDYIRAHRDWQQLNGPAFNSSAVWDVCLSNAKYPFPGIEYDFAPKDIAPPRAAGGSLGGGGIDILADTYSERPSIVPLPLEAPYPGVRCYTECEEWTQYPSGGVPYFYVGSTTHRGPIAQEIYI